MRMAEFRKTILKVGSFSSRDGTFQATAERLARFAEQFAEMKRRGIRVPICWGHQPFAEPDDPDSDANDPMVQARREYLASRFNAGYMLDLVFHANRGELETVGDVPGAVVDDEGNLLAWTQLPDSDEKVLTAISEVSAGVRNWTDGRGREWQDVIIHLALCVLPVVEGQSGFAQLSTQLDSARPPVVYLSLTNGARSLATQRGVSMDTPDLSKEQKKLKPSTAPNKATVLDTPAPDAAAGDDKDSAYKEFLNDLKECGIVVPEGTSPKEFFKVAHAAVKTKLHHDGAATEPIEPDAAALDTDVEDEDDEEKEDKVDKGMKEDATVEEPRPILMSTDANGNITITKTPDKPSTKKKPPAQPALLSTMAKTPLERALLGREESRARKDRLSRINRLVLRGMPVAKGEELKKAASAYQLSLLPSGKAAKQNIDLILETWEEALPKKGFPDEFLLSTATEEERPEYATTGAKNEDVKKVAEERASKLSRGNAKA
jgi:hypothetical protein